MTHLFLLLVMSGLCQESHDKYLPINAYPTIYNAYQDILKLKLESGRNKLKGIIPTDSQLGHYHYVKNLADVLEILVTEDPKLYDKYEDHEEDNLRGLKEMDTENPYFLFYSSEIRIQWAIVKILFEDETKAGWSLKTAYSEVELNIKKFPEFTPNYKSFGVLHIVFAVVPETYHWLLKFFGVKGNSVLGWQELNRITPESPYNVETNIIKAMMAINIINKEEITMSILNELIKTQKDNLIVNYLYNTALIKYAKSEQALPSLKKLLYAGKEYSTISNINYKLGEIYIQKQQYALARYHYSLFLNNHAGQNHIKDAWFKIFLTYFLERNDKMAEIHWKKAQKSGLAIVAADVNANEILESDKYPNPNLMIARLATDGGYFLLATNALKSIQQGELKSKKDESEYFYRFGRLYDKEDEKQDAIFYYLNTIKKAGDENWYFAPSACLYAGYIYEKEKDYEKAWYFFNKAMEYKKHMYKEGIDSKAHASMELLKHKIKISND